MIAYRYTLMALRARRRHCSIFIVTIYHNAPSRVKLDKLPIPCGVIIILFAFNHHGYRCWHRNDTIFHEVIFLYQDGAYRVG